MDACHLLLGRPWQFDRAVFHDGRANTYSFLFLNKKIVLLPSHAKVSSDANTHISFLTHAPFEAAMNESGMVYLLLASPFALSQDVPPSVQTLLHQFRDVFQNDLPDELPPLLDVQHCIDLIPGRHYRIGPTTA